MKLSHTFWRICLRERNGNETIISDLNRSFELVPNPPNGWAADPFIYEKEGSLYIFAELYDTSKFKGSIGYCIYKNGTFSDWKTIITDDYHFSYPYVFEMKDKVYLMPEAGNAGLIPLYRAKDFPNEWEKLTPLYEGEKMADTTFLWKNYLISQHMQEKGNSALVFSIKTIDDSTFRLKAESEFEDRFDVHRPAGKPWLQGEDLIRPAQNSQDYYGKSLIFYQTDVNKLPILEEKEIARINPENVHIIGLSKRLTGLHTYNFSEHYEVIDVKYETISISNIFRRLCKKIK